MSRSAVRSQIGLAPSAGRPYDQSRLSKLPPLAARLLIAALCALALAPALAPRLVPPARQPTPTYVDSDLYRDITRDVQGGRDYYAAAEAEQRAHGYPTTPPQAFHPPTMALLLAALKTDLARRAISLILVAVTIVALRRRLEEVDMPGPLRTIGAVVAASGATLAWWPGGLYMHEAWAGVLITLSLALYRPNRAGWAIACAVAACLTRELALPYIVVMAGFAALERRWREALGWSLAACALIGLYAIHLRLAGPHHQPGDLPSQGWITFNGWAFAVEAGRRNILLLFLPPALASGALLASLLGYADRADPWTSRCGAVFALYETAFLVAGRPDNAYWGDMIGPLIALGWVLTPGALAHLWRAATPPRALRGEAD